MTNLVKAMPVGLFLGTPAAYSQAQIGGSLGSLHGGSSDSGVAMIVLGGIVALLVFRYFLGVWFLERVFAPGLNAVLKALGYVLGPPFRLIGGVMGFAGSKAILMLTYPSRRREERERVTYARLNREFEDRFRRWAEPKLFARFPTGDAAYLGAIIRQMEVPRRDDGESFREDKFGLRVYWRGDIGGDRLDIYYGTKCLYSLPVDLGKLGEPSQARSRT